jgi:hypothetical protein
MLEKGEMLITFIYMFITQNPWYCWNRIECPLEGMENKCCWIIIAVVDGNLFEG